MIKKGKQITRLWSSKRQHSRCRYCGDRTYYRVAEKRYYCPSCQSYVTDLPYEPQDVPTHGIENPWKSERKKNVQD
jgi:ribosomal protein L37AE/L43A